MTASWRDWLDRPGMRRGHKLVSILGAPRQWVLRRRAAQAFLAGLEGGRIEREGYERFEAGRFPGGGALLERCRELRRARTPLLPQERARRGDRSGVAIELTSDVELARQPELMEFALQAEVAGPVVAALGRVPFLARIGVALSSPPLPGRPPAYFQRFHVDNDDLRHVKLVIHVSEVTEADGPLCFLPAPVSARVLRALRNERGRPRRTGAAYWAFEDEEVFRHCSPSDMVQLTGPAGSGAYVDLSRCLHFGSRVEEGHERLVYGVVFVPYHRLRENATSSLPQRSGGLPWQRLLLEPPRRRPPGTFFPEWPATLEQRATP